MDDTMLLLKSNKSSSQQNDRNAKKNVKIKMYEYH